MHKYKLYSAVLRIGKNFVEDFAVILCLSIMFCLCPILNEKFI